MISKEKRLRFLILVLIIISMISIIPSCKKLDSTSGSITMGRYVEEKITLPEEYKDYNIIGLLMNSEGKLEVFLNKYEESLFVKLTRNNSDIWDIKEQPWLSNFIAEDETEVKRVILGKDEIYYVLVSRLDEVEHILTSSIYQSQGEDDEPRKMNIPSFDEIEYNTIADYKRKPQIENFGVLKNGNIIASDMYRSGISVYSKETGEILKNLDSVFPFDIKGNDIYASKLEDKAIIKYSDSIEIEIAVDSSVIEGKITVSDKALYLLNSRGIHRLGNNGEIWQTLVDGALTSLSIPKNKFSYFVIGESEFDEFFVLIKNETNESIYHYYYDETKTSVPDKEITLYSLFESSSIRQAIYNFQKENNDVKVNYVVAMGENNSATISDSIRALNAELMAGDGADLLVLDGLPIEALKEKGILEDISDIVMPLLENKTLNPNIIRSFIDNNSIYAIPIRFQPLFFYGSKDILDALSSMDALVQYIENNTEKRALSSMSYDQLGSTFFLLNYNDLINVNNTIDKDDFIHFLKNLKEISNNIEASNEYWDINNELKEGIIKLDNASMRQDFEMLEGTTEAGIMQVRSITNYVFPAYTIREKSFSYQSIDNQFIPNIIIGLNKVSKSKELAKDFIRTLFSEEIQNSVFEDGLPVNNNVFTKWMVEYNQANKRSTFAMATYDETYTKIVDYPSSKEVIELFSKAKHLDKPIMYNKVLIDEIVKNITRYLNESATAEQVAQDTINLIDTYVSE